MPLGPDGLYAAGISPLGGAKVGDALYFLGADNLAGPITLWRTDGTTAQTQRLADNPAYSDLVGLTVLEVTASGGSVYFTATAGLGSPPTPPIPGMPPFGPLPSTDVWKLDAAVPGGLTRLTTLAPGSSATGLRAADGRVFFGVSAYAALPMPMSSQQLWVTDGTTGGTGQVASFDGPFTFADLAGTVAAGGSLYFSIMTMSPMGMGSALYVSDGTAAGTKALTGPGTNYTDFTINGRVAAGGKLFFSVARGAGDQELWVSDGSSLTPLLTIAPPPMPGDYSIRALTAAGNHVVFAAPAAGGPTVWTSDGTAAGTQPAISPALFAAVAGLQWIDNLKPAGDDLYFTAFDPAHGSELWVCDGAEVRLVKDVRPGPESGTVFNLTPVGSGVYFTADDGISGMELWRTDGTSAGTVRVTDLNPGIGWSSPGAPVPLNGKVLFTATDGGPGPGAIALPRVWALQDGAAPTGTSTVTTLSVPVTDLTVGQTVSLTATVAANGGAIPTGEVVFRNDFTIFGTVPLANGSASLDVTTPVAGLQQFQAIFRGGDTFAGSLSAPVPVSVNPVASVVTLTASDLTPVAGQTVTLTAAVQPSSPGAAPVEGFVTFFDGAFTYLGMGMLVGGVATCQAVWATPGTHSAVANFSGNGVYGPGSSTPLAVEVAAGPTITISSSAPAAAVGQAVTLTAHVAPASPTDPTPTGSITFVDGMIPLGTINLDGAANASLTISTLGPGAHAIQAIYHGPDGDIASLFFTQAVDLPAPTTTLQATAAGKSVTLTATVTPPPGSILPLYGSVTFRDGATVLGTINVGPDAPAVLAVTLPSGPHVLTAEFGNSLAYPGSTSAPVLLDIAPVLTATTTALASSSSSVAAGRPVRFTATVTAAGGAMPTGTVTFKDGDTVLGTVSLNSAGKAVLAVNTLGAGRHRITAHYQGAGSFAASTSAALQQTVLPATTATLSVSNPRPVYGQPLTLTATVAGKTGGAAKPGGTVTFKDGTRIIGTAPLRNGVATLQVTRPAAGTHQFTAHFAGNALFAASVSSAREVVVRRATTVTTAVAWPTSSGASQNVTLTAAVGISSPGAGTPAGVVRFYAGTKLLGAVPVSKGKAVLKTGQIPTGVHALRAVYLGDSNFTGSWTSTHSYIVRPTIG